jgi:hypothetical protein
VEKNAAFYRSENAPAFVLWRLGPIDDRPPTLEDGLAMLEILHRYRPELQENKYLLLRRGPSPVSSTPGKVVLDRAVALDEEISLEGLQGDYLTLTIQLDYSAWGRVQNVLETPMPAGLVLTHDGEEKPASFRLIPGMAKTEFLLSPYLAKNADIVDFYEGKMGKRVRALRITVPQEGRNSFVPQVHVVVREYSR